MDAFKEFEGKSLDEAIREACDYYNTSREKLEIDIIQDAKSGVFGLIGARKAKINARKVQLRATVENILGRSRGPAAVLEPEQRGEGAASADEAQASAPSEEAARALEREADGRERRPRGEGSRGPKAAAEQPRHKPRKEGKTRPAAEDERADAEASGKHGADRPAEADRERETDGRREREGEGRRGRDNFRPEGRRPEAARPRGKREAQADESAIAPALNEFMDDIDNQGLPAMRLDDVDVEKLCELCVNTIDRLVTPIIGKSELSAELSGGRVNVSIDCGEDSGLLIGREGQTLASLQFLASRIVSQSMGFIVRVQLDAGEYRLRQYEKLRELALSLAEKVRGTGKSYSTRPMSSYHRRIIHMTLQDNPDVQTRSTGDGPLKRVVVQRRKHQIQS